MYIHRYKFMMPIRSLNKPLNSSLDNKRIAASKEAHAWRVSKRGFGVYHLHFRQGYFIRTYVNVIDLLPKFYQTPRISIRYSVSTSLPHNDINNAAIVTSW